MALYHLSVKPVSRGGGRSAVACAAYRSADVLHDERLGQTHDYARKRGVEAAFIVAPMEAVWAQERERLWNAAEAAEKRKDARVGREYELALPCELDREGRHELVEAFAGELVERFGVAVDAAIHAPGREGDQRNWHAHVLTTTRRAEAGGLGEKAAIELSDTARAKQGLGKAADEIETIRAYWAGQVNRALERVRVAERVDHRSYARQGRPELEATQHAGPAVSGMERKTERQRVQAQARQGRAQGVEASAAAEVPGMAPLAPERPQEGQEWSREAARAVPAPVEVSGPAQGRQAVQEGLERPRAAQERATAFRPVESPARGQDGPVRPAAGMFGAGAEPVTRVGQRNAEIQERNRAVEAARKAVEQAQRVLEGLERAVRRAMDLARGLGAQVVEARQMRERELARQREAQERAQAVLRAEVERQQRDAAELRRQEAERARPAIATQAQREAARARTASVWGGVEEAGRRAREASEASRRQQAAERESQRQGPSLGM